MQTTRTMIALLAAAGMVTAAGSLAYAQKSQPTVQAPVQQAIAPAAVAEAVPVTAPAAAPQPAPIGIEQAIAAAQKHHPGSKVKDVEIKGKHGIMVYRSFTDASPGSRVHNSSHASPHQPWRLRMGPTHRLCAYC